MRKSFLFSILCYWTDVDIFPFGVILVLWYLMDSAVVAMMEFLELDISHRFGGEFMFDPVDVE